MRALFALLLSFVLALASVSMAVARGQAPMGSTIALCTEDGAVTVVLDAKGNPMPGTAPHLCPDCLPAATVFDLTAPVLLTAPETTARSLHPRPVPVGLTAATPLVALARGPPRFSV